MEDWKKKIEDSARDLEVPDSLRPEQIGDRLEQKRKVRPFYRRPVIRTVAAAAAVILFLAGIWGIQGIGTIMGYRGTMNEMAQSGSMPAASKTTEMEAAADAAADIAGSGDAGMTADEGGTQDYAINEGQDESMPESSPENDEEEADESFGEYYHTSTHEKLKNELKKVWEKEKSREERGEYGVQCDGADTGATMESAESAAGMGEQSRIEEDAAEGTSDDYSKTNLQVAGVDEGDIVKTDGTYLYILSSEKGLRIVRAEGLEVVAEIPMELEGGDVNYKEMYVDDGQLILVGNQYESSIGETSEDVYYMNSVDRTVMVVYDLSDIEKPEMTGKVSQDGYYRTSRKVGHYFYLFSDYYYYADEQFNEDSAIPRVNDTAVSEEQIYVPAEISECRYLVMSAVNIEDPDHIIDQKALLNSGEQFYITKSSIYIIQYEGTRHWYQNQIYSNFIRFKMNKGQIRAVAAASLKGELTDTFAVSESGGYLRTFLTDWSSTSGGDPVNRVYVLDGNMKICGTIEDLAPGETIYSARFMGNKGYFVTYRNTDPLFSVDFSDPSNPKILGELKVTGFSEYLHFYGSGKLLGLGWETDPDTGQTLGLKLSMYDIRNPEQVTEERKLVLENVDYCDALYNYKAVLADPEKNLIGFTVGSYGTDKYKEKYVVFSYDQTEGFVKKLEFDLGGEEEYYSYGMARGIYIGEILYVTEQNRVAAFDMKNKFEKMGSLELAEKR